MVKLVECPRDAMQGIRRYIPASLKADYINALLAVGFDTIDFGSFVSPKAIPQMQDTASVLKKLDLSETKSRLLAIVANERGAREALAFPEISFIGFPFSVSETFQKRNTNSTITESLCTVDKIQEMCLSGNRNLVIYISMGFGNPYGDLWNTDIVAGWVEKIAAMGIKTISLSDTVGVADIGSIRSLFSSLIPACPSVEFGAHLHTTPASWKEKIETAYASGCRRFDSAIKGFGGCPMAKDELVGNMPTERLVEFFSERGVLPGMDLSELAAAGRIAEVVFI